MRAIRATVCAIVLLAACAQHRPISVEVQPEVLHQRQSEFLAALASRDLEATLAHFGDDAVLHVAGMPSLRGSPAIRRFYENVFRFLTASESVPEITRVSEGGDIAYSVGSVVNTFRGDPAPAEFTGKYLLVWERRDGAWRVAAYSISSDRPESGARR